VIEMAESIWISEHDGETVCGNCIYYTPGLCTKLQFPLQPDHDPCVDFRSKIEQHQGFSFDTLKKGGSKKKQKEKKTKKKEPVQSVLYTCGACDFYNDNFCSKQSFPVEENQIKCSRFSSRVIKELSLDPLSPKKKIPKKEPETIHTPRQEQVPTQTIETEPTCNNCQFFDYNFCSKRTIPAKPDQIKCSKYKGISSKVPKQKKEKISTKKVKEKPKKEPVGEIEPICMNCQFFADNFCSKISSPIRRERPICDKFKSKIKGKLKPLQSKYDDIHIPEEELASLDSNFSNVVTSYAEEDNQALKTITGLTTSKYKLLEEDYAGYTCGNCSYYELDMCTKFSTPVDYNQNTCTSFVDKDAPKNESDQTSMSDIMKKLDRLKNTYGEDVFKDLFGNKK